MTRAMEQLADFYREDVAWWTRRIEYWDAIIAEGGDPLTRRWGEQQRAVAEELLADSERGLARITGQGDA